MNRLLATFALASALGAATAARAQTAQPDAPASAPTMNSDFISRLIQAYRDDWNPPPADPNAQPEAPTRRPAPFPPAPLPSPPYPSADWSYGGSSTIGASQPNQVDSPLTTALWGGPGGQALKDSGIQIYGWIEPSLNFSTSTTRKLGNAPGAYYAYPNSIQLDQLALYFERVPDTVQQDHVDWGFRVTNLFGTDYRYTTARGIFSDQLLGQNRQYGYDMPMFYGELYVPGVAQGMMIRAGRYISLPDIEAQLAPDNYMFSHSLLYTFDPYTNLGVNVTIQLDNNWMVQAGITDGNDVEPWVAHDPGNQPSGTVCVRWNSDTSRDNVYGCINTFNNAHWGYNNLQQNVITYYHKFNDRWHIAFESWYMYERDTPNTLNPNGPANPLYPSFPSLNGPNGAYCRNGQPECTSREYAALAYLNYQIGPSDNLSLRGEFFDDLNGQRTGYKTPYVETAIGWQHWIGGTITIRPELTYYYAFNATPFNVGTARAQLVAASDVIWHF